MDEVIAVKPDATVVVMQDTFNLMCNENLEATNPPTFKQEFMDFLARLVMLRTKSGLVYYKVLE